MNHSADGKTAVFIGSYAEAGESGIYACWFDAEKGQLTMVDRVSGWKNPTFLDFDPGKHLLYSLAEGLSPAGERCGVAVSFQVNPDTLSLKLLNEEIALDAPTCHLVLDRTKQCLLSSSYHGGRIGVSSIEKDGRIGPMSEIHAHTGSSLLPVQSQARVHSASIDRNNRYAIICDLGLDKVVVYRLDPQAGLKLDRHSEVKVAPGSGPRHFAFHPDGTYGYVINELSSTITVFAYDEDEGVLTEIQTLSTLPAGFTGENACAEIQVSSDGRFVYGSNRGHDSIAVYAVDRGTGMLTPVEHVSTLGGHPRHFALSPDGRFVLAANRDGNNVVTLVRDRETGKLQHNGQQLTLSMPVCVRFAEW